LALKYIFGFETCSYGHFDEVILMHDQLGKLRDLCDRFLKTHLPNPSTPEDKVKVAKLVVALRQKALEQARSKLEEVRGNESTGSG
jgi:hypothetical protein